MRLRIVCVGKIREKWLSEGIAEYRKRLSRYCETEIVEVPDSPDSLPDKQIAGREGAAILSRVKSSSVVWLMDLSGETMDSAGFSRELMKGFENGGSEITIVIGGSNGFSDEVIDRADRRIRFSDMTFTHPMSRLILLEQCFRAFKIARGETYHK
ncbi:MAG: 23S rRNA (pseudouridine(1915)-N(3))-methyltransferase RlmH [Clostridiaceae bacterium]|nr:23S rRNA (pseudouridine(1915)-N(3))-methyltransferase RlmH [Clostridiaceae bacterium]